jgi:hypothetical protein
MLIDEIAAASPVRIYRAVSKLDFRVNKVLTQFGTQERLAFICNDSPLPSSAALPRDQTKLSVLFWQWHGITHFSEARTSPVTSAPFPSCSPARQHE